MFPSLRSTNTVVEFLCLVMRLTTLNTFIILKIASDSEILFEPACLFFVKVTLSPIKAICFWSFFSRNTSSWNVFSAYSHFHKFTGSTLCIVGGSQTHTLAQLFSCFSRGAVSSASSSTSLAACSERGGWCISTRAL